jgi:1-acyl-sn-glycerol-3-phosphate acyltransferase
MFRALIVVVFLALYILIVGPPFILHCVLTGNVEPLYLIGVGGAKLAMRLGGVRVRTEGLQNIPPEVCIFVANHTSNADPPAVVSAIPRRVALLGKKEVFRVPILARALRLASFVSVDRSNREAAIASVERALVELKKGVSFLVFPEGTRSPDARLRPFKKGTFVMAIRAGVPVVPISVVGAHCIMRKGEFALRPGEILVKFHLPVDARQFSADAKEELIARVHAVVAAGLPEDQKPLAERSFDAPSDAGREGIPPSKRREPADI